ncbi:SAM-dependent methyltransferase [Raineya orbicola]|uniref:Putative methyltransferase n=1 Tax=Raineya orbicola TaxID=2016530 RepID=A0A2N3I949_9BACT|nr:SAM-dependent methyltransferase [Raineya orbicola]PKQ66862.1 putative methyltransferase [Raineya orbicola]
MLYLIPNLLAPHTHRQVLTSQVYEVVKQIQNFIVEDIRSARRFLSSLQVGIEIDKLSFFEIGKHADFGQLAPALTLLKQQIPVGLLSEAGCPAIADPGAFVVAWCHENNVKVVPLVGASSILLALIASGFNGQNFCFHGYLPIDKQERNQKIKDLENAIYQNNQTQIFIETPFRNNDLLKSILQICRPHTKLCLACNLTAPDELIRTQTISLWSKNPPDLHKKPCVFLIYK